jgi:hypothetical protein
MDTWLEDFQLVQPDQFFRDHPTNDTDLLSTVQSS